MILINNFTTITFAVTTNEIMVVQSLLRITTWSWSISVFQKVFFSNFAKHGFNYKGFRFIWRRSRLSLKFDWKDCKGTNYVRLHKKTFCSNSVLKIKLSIFHCSTKHRFVNFFAVTKLILLRKKVDFFVTSHLFAFNIVFFLFVAPSWQKNQINQKMTMQMCKERL